MIKYPEIKVKLTGQDGNAFSILGIMKKSLRKGGVDPKEIDDFMTKAMSGDYDNLLASCAEMVTIS